MDRKPTVPVYSQELHAPISHESAPKARTSSKYIILTIIFLLIAIIIAFTIFALLFKNEYIVKSKLEYLARDYYENYLYDAFENSAKSSSSSIEEILSKHTDRGLSRISLRQLILHDAKNNTEIADYLREYCDENKTFMQVFPESPFSKTSYHIKYTYSCNFQ